ncbi:MAG: tetratricopeptide repeat protein [Pseudomonadota bacterium]
MKIAQFFKEQKSKTALVVVGLILIGAPIASCTMHKSNLSNLKKMSEAELQMAEAYRLEGRYAEALQELLKAKDYYDKDPLLYNNLGLVYIAKHEYTKALESFQKALEIDPENAEIANNMGGTYIVLKEWDKAIQCFEKASKNLLYPTPHRPLTNLGIVCYEMKDYQRSISYFKKALDAVPIFYEGDKNQIYKGIGCSYIAIGNYKEAIKNLEKAVSLAKTFAVAYYELGIAYSMSDFPDKALESFDKALKITKNDTLREQVQAAIDRLKQQRHQ